MRYRYTSLPSQRARFVEGLTSPSTVLGNQGRIVGAPGIDHGIVCDGTPKGLVWNAASIAPNQLAAISGCRQLTLADNYTLTGAKVSLVTSVVGPSFAQAVDARRPIVSGTTLNGHVALMFSGGQLLQGVSALDLSPYTSATLFVVFRDSTAAASIVVEQGPNASLNDGFYMAVNDGGATRTACSLNGSGAGARNVRYTNDNAAFSIYQWDMDTLEVAANQILARVNNVSQALTTVVAGPTAGNLANDFVYLGARTGAVAPITGEWVALAVYAPKLSAADRARANAAWTSYTGIST